MIHDATSPETPWPRMNDVALVGWITRETKALSRLWCWQTGAASWPGGGYGDTCSSLLTGPFWIHWKKKKKRSFCPKKKRTSDLDDHCGHDLGRSQRAQPPAEDLPACSNRWKPPARLLHRCCSSRFHLKQMSANSAVYKQSISNPQIRSSGPETWNISFISL